MKKRIMSLLLIMCMVLCLCACGGGGKYKAVKTVRSQDYVLYQCQSLICGQEVRYELKYILKEARWELFKM